MTNWVDLHVYQNKIYGLWKISFIFFCSKNVVFQIWFICLKFHKWSCWNSGIICKTFFFVQVIFKIKYQVINVRDIFWMWLSVLVHYMIYQYVSLYCLMLLVDRLTNTSHIWCLIKIIIFWYRYFQQDHVTGSLDDLMSRYKPPVKKHRYRLKFVPVVDHKCSEEEIIKQCSYDAR